MSNKVVLVTGAGGLIGSEVVEFHCKQGHRVIGLDNNARQEFFGSEGSVIWRIEELRKKYTSDFICLDIDIQDNSTLDIMLRDIKTDLIIHTAAQPSHDWAVKDPQKDFNTNANGTLNMLEFLRNHAPEATFIFTSTNKVYGDQPNMLEYEEHEKRWSPLNLDTALFGFNETLSIDNCLHSLFGVSKLAADLLVQEYGKYFKLNTGVFRGGCLTGPNHSGVELHGFLSYLVKCAVLGREYNIYGYKGKQVRDNIHSKDLISAFDEFTKNPKQGEVYNIGGGTFSNCSIIEAKQIIENISPFKLKTNYIDKPRIGDHKWWISDTRKFEFDYPNWKQVYKIDMIIKDILEGLAKP